MVLQHLNRILERLRLGLRDHRCDVCLKQPLTEAMPYICHSCQQTLEIRENTPLFTNETGNIYTACHFPQGLKSQIYGLKFEQQHHVAVGLSKILLHYWTQHPDKPTQASVITIPARSQRPYPFLTGIARPFATYLGYDYTHEALLWQRETMRQHKVLSKWKRLENTQGALGLHTRFQKHFQKKPKHLIVVDDIVTTGATMREAMRTLKQAFPDTPITGLALAHVPLSKPRQPVTQKEFSS